MKALILSGLSALALVATAAIGQPPEPPPPPPPPMPCAGPMPLQSPQPLADSRAETEARTRAHFVAADTDHDGFVTRAEADARFAAFTQEARAQAREGLDRYFGMIDANHDGTISRAEFDTFHDRPRTADGDAGGPAGAGAAGDRRVLTLRGGGDAMEGAMIGPLFDRIDTDRDGRLSLAESISAALRRFDRADTDHDGRLSNDERAAAGSRVVMRMRGERPRLQ